MMRQRNRLILNALANIGSRAVALAARFLIVPFAVCVLGRGHYGIWIVVGQIFAYTRILEMGLRSAVVRQVALRYERGEHEKLNRYVNTAGAYTCAVGAGVALITVALAVFYPNWFVVERSLETPARLMVLCAGFALALTIPQYAYGAVLAGRQRFDVISATQIGVEIVRLVLIFTLLERMSTGGRLILLAVAAGGSTLLGATVRTIVSLWMCRTVKFEPWRIDFSLLREMVTFGLGSVVYMMSGMVAAQLAHILIGAMMSTAEATDFSLVMVMILAVHVFVVACTMAIRPAASRYDGRQDPAMLRHLFVRATRYTAVVALMGLLPLCVFPEAFLRLWQSDSYAGPEGAAAIAQIARTCRILSAGFGLFWLMLPAYSVLNGMGRHRVPAVMGACSALTSMCLVFLLSGREGATIETVAWGVMLPMIPTWGVAMVWYGCREVGEPVGRFLWRGLGPAVVCAAPPIAVALVLNRLYPASSWAALIGEVGVALAVLVPLGWFVGACADDKAAVMGSLAGWLRRLRGG